MKPYYEQDGITIYHADCRDVLPTLADGSVDLVLTDPPYGLQDGKGKVGKRGDAIGDLVTGDWDKDLPLEWLAYAANLLKPGRWCVAFTDNLSVKAVWDAMENAGLHPKHTFYWIKVNPPPQPRNNFCSAVETAVVATKGAVKVWHGGGWLRNCYETPLVGNQERLGHPTQKPEELMRMLIGRLCDNGGVVLDPFMGSGTTLRAAKDLGMKAIGIELSERYCEIAVKRLAQQVLPMEVTA